MKRKAIGLKLTTALMTAVLAMQTPLHAIQASAATAAKYLSEVILSYGNSDTEAKNWLKQNGYTVVDQNLNEGGYGGYEAMSWLGIASTRRSVYLGYKTTTDANEAITDMKIMNMNGGYSLQAYEKVLEQTKREKEHFLENMMAALKEYRANYKAGKLKAQIAHDALNKFRDDDSGQLMGDLLLNTLKTEDEAAWEADPTQHADMVTILMQGNSTCVSEIMQNLAIAQDTADDSWLNRAMKELSQANNPPVAEKTDADTDTETETEPADTDAETETVTADTDTETETEPAETDNETETDRVYYKNGLELMIAEMQEQFPNYSKSAIVTMLMAEYDKDAKMMASSLVGLANYLLNYTQSGLSGEATQEEADAYFAEHEFESAGTWASAYTLFKVMQDNWYGTTPLLNYLVYSDYDYLTDSAYLEGYEGYGLPQRALLYPLVAQMSNGQRSLLEYTAMNRMVTMGLMDEEVWSSLDATMQDPKFGAADLEVCSMYAEVNRDDFQVGSIAVTNVAQGKQATTGETMDNGLFGTGISYLSAGIAIGGLAVSVAGCVLAVKNWSTSSVAGKSLANITNDNVSNVVVNNIQQQPIKLSDDVLMYQKGIKKLMGLGIDSASKETNYNMFKKYEQTYLSKYNLTVSGPNDDVFTAGVVYDDTNQTVTTFDGWVYDMKEGTAPVYKAEFDQLKQVNQQQLNPDLAQKIDDVGEMITEEMSKEADKFLRQQYLEMSDQLRDAFDDFCIDRLIKHRIRADRVFPSDLTLEEMEDFADYLKKRGVATDERMLDTWVEQKKIMEQYQNQQIASNVEDLGQNGKKLSEQADDAMTAATGSSFWKWFGVGMAIIGLVMSAYGIYSMISEMKEYYHVEMLPIPRKMVDLGYLSDGSSCYIYYDCVQCNRAEVGMKNDTLGVYGDMNGDVMKEWLALYTTKDTRAGDPIKAGFTVKKGTSTPPVNTVPLSFFGFESAVNMTDTSYSYNDDKNGIYLYYKTNIGAGYTGTVTTSNALVTTGVLSAIGGAGLCGLITALAGKRRRKSENAA